VRKAVAMAIPYDDIMTAIVRTLVCLLIKPRSFQYAGSAED